MKQRQRVTTRIQTPTSHSYSSIPLVTLSEKLVNGLEASKDKKRLKVDFYSIEKKYKKETKRSAEPIVYLEHMNAIPSIFCDRCVYNAQCPFYAKACACIFVTQSFDLPREAVRFVPELLQLINTQIQSSSVFTENQVFQDSYRAFVLGYLFARTVSDLRKKVVYPSTRRWKLNQDCSKEQGRFIFPSEHSSRNDAKFLNEIEKKKERCKILGLPFKNPYF